MMINVKPVEVYPILSVSQSMNLAFDREDDCHQG